MTVTLDVLPAAHGDALVITYGPAGGEHRILQPTLLSTSVMGTLARWEDEEPDAVA